MPNAAALKVLVVDDQASVRQMTRISLEKLGIRMIHEAPNGQAALVTLLATAFSLGGRRLVGRLLPAWLLLWLAIPLPGRLDRQFIATLRGLWDGLTAHMERRY